MFELRFIQSFVDTIGGDFGLNEYASEDDWDLASVDVASSDDRAFDERTLRIRHLNDQLRVHGLGGVIICTQGILNLETDTIAAIGDAIRSFNDFNEDNDPHGEHDSAMVSVDDHQVIFKVDYYDVTLSHHSPDASDTSVTKRVMTIMLSEEY